MLFQDRLNFHRTLHRLTCFSVHATERVSPGLNDYFAIHEQLCAPTRNALVGEFMVAFLLVFIASRTAVNSDFFYSSMACFAIGAQVITHFSQDRVQQRLHPQTRKPWLARAVFTSCRHISMSKWRPRSLTRAMMVTRWIENTRFASSRTQDGDFQYL